MERGNALREERGGSEEEQEEVHRFYFAHFLFPCFCFVIFNYTNPFNVICVLHVSFRFEDTIKETRRRMNRESERERASEMLKH